MSTTYEQLYKPAIQEYLRKWNTFLDKFHMQNAEQMNILQLKAELKSRKAQLAELEGTRPTPFDFNLQEAVAKSFETAQWAYDQAVANTRKQFVQKREALSLQHDKDVALVESNAESSVDSLISKHTELLSYQDKVSDAVIRYGIKPSELMLDVDSLSRQEMSDLLDSSIKACKVLGSNNMRDTLKRWCEPPSAGKDMRKQAALTILIVTFFLAPVALVGLFGYMYTHLAKVYRSVEALRVADKLMYGVNFAKYKEAPDYASIPELDFTAIEEEEAAALEALQKENPHTAQEALQKEINQNQSKIGADYRDATNSIVNRYNLLVKAYQEGVAVLEKTVQDYLDNQKPFGSVYSESYVLNTQFVLGQEDGVVDVPYDMGLRNIVFKERTPQMLQFMKLLFSNLMLNVRPKQFYCTIYDPEGLGADFATFLSQDTANYFKVETKELNKCLDDQRAYSQHNLRILDELDINTFNKDAAEKGMVTLEYKLLMILSGAGKVEENRVLTEFMQFSARTGAFVWLINPTPVQECTFYKAPFDGVAHPYPVDSPVFNRSMQTFEAALKKLKDPGIDYLNSFANKYLPREKWWTENADKGIKLNMGLQDGDPAKGFDLWLGDAPVHGVCVGGTGAGKSVFNNQLIASLILRYPPSALELLLVDFKNVEFVNLTDKQTHLSRIPHAKVVAGTRDGEYAISIFDYLTGEMDRRTALFDKLDVKKLKDYNEKMRIAGTPEQALPRILIIIDEFQVMFTEVDPKSVDIIQARIRSVAKLGRSFGVHMLFTSQSMKGTMPKDVMDQFSLRIALRCSSDASSGVLGSPIASKIKQQYGYLYTNTAGGETQDTTKLWRTPNIPDGVLYDRDKLALGKKKGEFPEDMECLLDIVTRMAEERGEINRKAYFYSDKEFFPDTKLLEWLKEHDELVQQEERLFLIGERTGFSLKTSPVNFKLKKADGENILLYGFEAVDFNNLCMTMVDNIKAVKEATLLLNCADPDLFTALGIEDWYNPDYMEIARPMTNVVEWLDMLEGLIEQRRADPEGDYKPLYFMALRWDKQLGICIDENYKLQDRVKRILTMGPAVDVHIILAVQTDKPVSSSWIGVINHTICAKGTESAGYKFQDSNKCSKLPQEPGYALYKYGSALQKFKIYQHTFARKVESRELDF